MKTEIDRVCGIMHTLLAHEPIIDVPYEKINDIAVALVKEGYGNILEYETEREMLRSQIKVLEQRLNDKYIEVDNLNHDYRNTFERVKTQEREIEKLKVDYAKLFLAQQNKEYREQQKQVKQAQIDVLNKVKNSIIKLPYEKLTAVEAYRVCNLIDDLIKEVEE